MTHEEMIELIKAEMDGKQIQRAPTGLDWVGSFLDHSIAEEGLPAGYIYQVKPEPRVIWVNNYEGGSFEAFKSFDKARSDADGWGCPVITRKFIEVEE